MPRVLAVLRIGVREGQVLAELRAHGEHFMAHLAKTRTWACLAHDTAGHERACSDAENGYGVSLSRRFRSAGHRWAWRLGLSRNNSRGFRPRLVSGRGEQAASVRGVRCG